MYKINFEDYSEDIQNRVKHVIEHFKAKRFGFLENFEMEYLNHILFDGLEESVQDLRDAIVIHASDLCKDDNNLFHNHVWDNMSACTTLCDYRLFK